MDNLNNEVEETKRTITEEEFANKMCSEEPIENLMGAEVISNDGKSVYKITNVMTF